MKLPNPLVFVVVLYLPWFPSTIFASSPLRSDPGLAAAFAEAQLSARPVGETPERWSMRNAAHGFHAEFAPSGLALRVSSPTQAKPSYETSWRSVGLGRGEAYEALEQGVLHAEGARVEIRREGIVEWFVNRSEGLEHGYTLPERPLSSEPADGRLRVEIAIAGDLDAEVVDGGLHVVLRDSSGSEVLRYERLKVWDATGRILEAELNGGGRHLSLEVDDADAVYPVTIDPTFVQQAYLKASNPETDDYFGHSAAISGDTVVVGAWGEDSASTAINGDQGDNSAENAGAAYVFVRSGGVWSQQAYLKPFNTGSFDLFGISVAIDGDTIVVGAPWEDGSSVGVDGPDNDGANGSGAAYVFVRTGATWTQQAYLKASNTGAGDQFGVSVAVSGDTVIVGAWEEDNSASNSGAAYVFVRDATTWSQQAYLKASNVGMWDRFGVSVDIDGDTAVVGADREASSATGVDGDQSDNSALNAGAAYVFVRNGAVWSQQAYLKASNTTAYDLFGEAVAVSGDTVVVGATGEDSSATGVNGDEQNNDALNSGAAYVFVRNEGAWSQQAYLKASNTGAGDFFGLGVSVDGHRVLVGAHGESSGATGFDGDGGDDSAPYSGAAYLFERTGGVWTQRHYIKASNAEADDIFGYAVAIDGDTFAVSAMQESSGASGVNGDQSDNSAFAAGAVYAFTLSQSAPAAPPHLTVTRPRAFPATEVGQRSRPQAVRVRNVGGTAATALAVRTSGKARRDFRLTRPARVLAPGGTTSFRATFRPRAKGLRRATVTVRASNAAARSVPLSGRGR